LNLEIKRVTRMCPWTKWNVSVQFHIKYVGGSAKHRKFVIARMVCSHAPRCVQRCMYNGKSRTEAPFKWGDAVPPTE
jgi:hypothetical protein